MKQAVATIRTSNGKKVKRRLPVTTYDEDMDDVIYLALMRIAQNMAVIEAGEDLVLDIEWMEVE